VTTQKYKKAFIIIDESLEFTFMAEREGFEAGWPAANVFIEY
jgi:hypothetical protein